jgi:hypothetical protein
VAFIKSDGLTPPELATETVAVEALGGDVRVRAMLLSERLGMEQRITRLRKEASDKGGTEDSNWLAIVPDVLALCVLDGSNRPVFSKARWENWGAVNLAASVQLFNVAWRLSGLGGESTDPKN